MSTQPHGGSGSPAEDGRAISAVRHRSVLVCVRCVVYVVTLGVTKDPWQALVAAAAVGAGGRPTA
jgi:hypothetical protein